MLAVDLFAHRKAHVIGVREAALWSGVWVACGLGFGALIWQIYGAEFGRQYFAGYLIEKSLAVDNMFVWPSSSRTSRSPASTSTGCCSSGSLGALIFRGIFIAAGSAIIASAGGCSTSSQHSCCHRLPHDPPPKEDLDPAKSGS